MADESIPNSPIWDDIKILDGNIFKRAIDIIYGGFPCQDISVAGHGKGLEGERSGLFFEIMRLAKEIKPPFIFLENVPAITTRGGLRIVREITEMGYDCRWCIISAASVGALHKRERWFLLARYRREEDKTIYSYSYGNQSSCKQKSEEDTEKRPAISGFYKDVANTKGLRCETERIRTIGLKKEESKFSFTDIDGNTKEHWQKTVSEMGKCSDGISYYVDRLRALGNAVVPQQAKEAFKILMGLKQ